ncbi:hypothetical protein Q9R32_01090 [Actinotalea sp. AC32]|nr:hypothetical protein [Actinotalea sp. AC32]
MRRLTTAAAVGTAAALLAGVLAGPASATPSAEPPAGLPSLAELADEVSGTPVAVGERAEVAGIGEAALITAPGRLVTGAPARVFDTRDPDVGPVGPGLDGVVWYDFSELMYLGATSVVLNVTATRGTSPTSFITVLDDNGGYAVPTTSSLNSSIGRDVANLVTVPLIGEGWVGLYNNSGWTHLVGDLQAVYVDANLAAGSGEVTGGLVLTGEPDRVLDTRTSTPLGPKGYRELQLTEAPEGAIAAVVTVTTTQATAPTSFISAWPYDAADRRPVPEVSILNAYKHSDIPNLSLLALGDDDTVTLYNNAGSTHVIVDVVGWFVADGGDAFHPITAQRAIGSGSIGHAEKRTFTSASSGLDLPAEVSAVALNLTTSRPSRPTYLTVYPAGTPRPATSSTNARLGADVATAAVTGVSDGWTVYNNQGTVRALVDVVGYFAPYGG